MGMPDPQERPFLTPTETAQLLGVSRTSVYRMISDGELPTVKLGGPRSTRIVTAELLRSVMRLDPVSAAG